MIGKLINRVKYFYKLYVKKDKMLVAYNQWIKDGGDNKLRYNYCLNENSVVFDLGGYKGEFAEKIYNLYQCEVYVFEPVTDYYNYMKEKFKNNEKIHLFKFGLSDENDELLISVDEASSSIYTNKKNHEKIEMKNILEFFREENVNEIDLFKINIEGGEYKVLLALINNGYMKKIYNLQIQFHKFVPNAEALKNKIRKDLIKTHNNKYTYEFIWEDWRMDEK